MGSLFYINVPTREHEISLRKTENKITVNKEFDGLDRNAVLVPIPSSPSISSKGPSGSTTSILAFGTRTASKTKVEERKTSSGSAVDVYEGTVDGRHANIVVSQDSMAIYTDDELEQAKVKEVDYQTVISNTFLEKHLEDCLKKFQIYDATWGASVDGNFSQISFTVQADKAETIINHMLTLGIGRTHESTLSVCSAVVYYNELSDTRKTSHSVEPGGDGTDAPSSKKEGFGSKFVASIKSRLTVAQVVQSVQGNATITFDFIVLIIIAGVIAALGLLEDSPVNLVASMLISPLMGPIMAGCFGAMIQDKNLIKTGLVSELVGLWICLTIGFIVGLSVQWHPFNGPWAGITRWPTNEMVSRGKLRSMIVGSMIAIPSGAGVALSILAGNAGSLVGVAISASLLPPAVNCGLFWGMSAVVAIRVQSNGHDPYQPCSGTIWEPVKNQWTLDYAPTHCKNVIMDFAILGICSFGLTLVNIVLILLSGFLVLKVKEVAPHTSRNSMKRFWKEDLKVMRDYNKIHGSFNKQALLNEIGNDADMIRAKIAKDSVFNQVAKRNIFGISNTEDVLESNSQETENKNQGTEAGHGGEGEPGATGGGAEEQQQNTGLGWSLFGFFTGSKKSTTNNLGLSRKQSQASKKTLKKQGSATAELNRSTSSPNNLRGN